MENIPSFRNCCFVSDCRVRSRARVRSNAAQTDEKMKEHQLLLSFLDKKIDFEIGLELLFKITSFIFLNRHKESLRPQRPTKPWPAGGFVEVHDMWFEAVLIAKNYGYALERISKPNAVVAKFSKIEK